MKGQKQKMATVLGATGGMGHSLVKECVNAGYQVRAVARRGEQLDRFFGAMPQVQIMRGDVSDPSFVQASAQNADLLFHAVNVPYRDWEHLQLPLMSSILEGASGHARRLVLVHPVYAYGRPQTEKVSEQHPVAPHTKKGNIRKQMEQMLQKAHEDGKIEGIIARFPDFYGPQAKNTFLHSVFEAIVNRKTAYWLGSLQLKREYIYVPDAARALLRICETSHPGFQVWNVSDEQPISGEEILSHVANLLSCQPAVKRAGALLLRIMGLLNKDVREVEEMYYLYDAPFYLDSSKFKSAFPDFTFTKIKEGIRETIAWLQQNRSV
ncbi:SDR family NAD(P)-dependent oxidoreductase [Lihuaxuella thermophila]|uniref:Nucleoside-diphosphate-sugar epimerase n=1 Tax=Lihuaxuella thermophila TaxID=1173111 RepID=A0A1H8CR93_9BACL|nr:SDR family NAD(P)-dependent oxidoreductase [Lihuaxuella thermophila]SEM97741.1 Nucleoside-diphosphate-sugar epimerase [Lihuaxuella thermophila]